MKCAIAACACILACTLPSFAQSKSVSIADSKFVRTALVAGTQEIRDGALSADSSDPRIAAFATRMVKDHSQANVQLLALARQLDVTVPNDVLPASGAQEQPTLPQGTAPQNRPAVFAKQYFQTQVSAHRKAIALFSKEVAEGGDPKIRAFARATLPTLNAHLALAEKDLKSAAH